MGSKETYKAAAELALKGLSRRLAAARKHKKMSQARVADTLEVSSQAVSLWERGESRPSIESLLKLSWLYDYSIDKLLLRNDLMPDEELDPGPEVKRGRPRTKNLPHPDMLD